MKNTKSIEARSRKELAGIEDTPDFNRLTLEQRLYLGAYIWKRDAEQAALDVRKDLAWVQEQKSDPYFLEVVSKVLDHPREFTKQLLLALAPMSVEKLRGLIEQDENKTVQLNAIKHLHHMVELVEDKVQPGALVDLKIQMFRSEPKKAVPSTFRTVEGTVVNDP